MKPHTELEKMDDHELIENIVAGNSQAIAHLLIDRCGSRFKYLATSRFSVLQLTFEEIVSESYIALSSQGWKPLRDFRGANIQGQSCRLENYVSVIVSRRLWKKMKPKMQEFEWIKPIDEIEDAAFSDSLLERKLNGAEIIKAIMSLKNPEDRRLIFLYKIEGHSVNEVAETLGISPANVYVRTSRAMKKLNQLLFEGDNTYV